MRCILAKRPSISKYLKENTMISTYGSVGRERERERDERERGK